MSNENNEEIELFDYMDEESESRKSLIRNMDIRFGKILPEPGKKYGKSRKRTVNRCE